VSDVTGAGIPGATVNITVISGPNTPQTSGPMSTNTNGEASWTYHGTSVGTDIIEVTGTLSDGTQLIPSQATKQWKDCSIPPIEVGGDIHRANKLVLLAPWIILGILLAACSTVIIRRRQAQS
jgi:hypothetical protein